MNVKVSNRNPLTAPSWFECFNAREIGEAINSGKAIAFISELNVHSGVDRVVAFFNDVKLIHRTNLMKNIRNE